MDSRKVFIDLNKRFKKSVVDLKNISNIKGKLDLIRQYIKFEFGKVTYEHESVAAFKYLLNPDFLFLYYWIGDNDEEGMKNMYEHFKKTVSSFEAKLKPNSARSPMIIHYIRTKVDLPNSKVSLKIGYDQATTYAHLEHEYNLRYLVCVSRYEAPNVPDIYTDYMKTFGFNITTGNVFSNFDKIQEFVKENYGKHA